MAETDTQWWWWADTKSAGKMMDYIYLMEVNDKNPVAGYRVLRLLACAISRDLGPQLSLRMSFVRDIIDESSLVEEYEEMLARMEDVAEGEGSPPSRPLRTGRPTDYRWTPTHYSALDAADSTVVHGLARSADDTKESIDARTARMADIIRDIVGDPFSKLKPVDGSELWLTEQVLNLAQVAYEHREADGRLDAVGLAVLSDALEEAGCDIACDKCRGSGTYTVRVTNAGLSTANGYGPSTTYSEWRGCRNCGGDYDRKGTGRMPHPFIKHLRSPGAKYRGMWSLDYILRKRRD